MFPHVPQFSVFFPTLFIVFLSFPWFFSVVFIRPAPAPVFHGQPGRLLLWKAGSASGRDHLEGIEWFLHTTYKNGDNWGMVNMALF